MTALVSLLDERRCKLIECPLIFAHHFT